MTQHFVVYTLKNEARFREEFDHAHGLKPQVTLHFSKPSHEVAHQYSADSANDRFLEVKPRAALSAAEQQKVIDCVQKAARGCGSSFCPVR